MENGASDMEVLHALVARVCRAFYEPKFVIVLDILTKVDVLKDDDLAARMKIQTKELHKICGRLKTEGLVASITKSEPRKNDQRPITRQYYYIDYKSFVDVVKWKMHQVRQLVRQQMDKELENKGYICSRCQKLYSPLEVLTLLDPSTGLFFCEIDNVELESNENTVGVKDSQDLHGRLMDQSGPIIALLKKTDDITYTIPTIRTDDATSADTAGTTDERDLRYAQDTGMATGEVIIEFEKDTAASKKAADAAAEKKRTQNALPIWHQHSTVSGEHATKSLEYNGSATASMLAGKSKPVGALDNEDETEDKESEFAEDTEKERDAYYAQYYANLQKEAVQREDETDDGDGLFLEEEDASDILKRKREEEEEDFDIDVGAEEPVAKKTRYSPEDEDEEDDEQFLAHLDEEEDDECMVSVEGVMVPLKDITDEHQERMTLDEYQAYYEMCQKYM